jgi:hypothetical protein
VAISCRRDRVRDRNRLLALMVEAINRRKEAASMIHRCSRAEPTQYSVSGVTTPCCDRE